MRQSTAQIALFIASFAVLSIAAPSRTSSVSGRVVGPAGKPVSGATVVFFRFGPSGFVKAAQAVTDSSGSFSLADSAADGAAGECIVTAPGLAIGGGRVAAAGRYRFVLSNPAAVAGRVVDSAGSPLPGVSVRVESIIFQAGVGAGPGVPSDLFLDLPGVPQIAAKSDANGRYVLTGLPSDSSATVAVDDDRYANEVGPPFPVGGAVPDLVAHRAGQIVGRLVYADGAPAEHIEVDAQSTPGTNAWGEAETDKSGVYDLGRLLAGEYNVCFAFPAGSQWVAAARADVGVAAGRAASVPDTIATHGALVTGAVTDSVTGKPVAGVDIGSYGPERPATSPGIVGSRSGNDGEYSLRVAPGASEVYVAGAPTGYLTPQGDPMTPVTVSAGDDKVIDFKLDPALSIAGRAVDESGSPVAGVSISAAPLGEPGHAPLGQAPAATSADGSFSLTGLAEGGYAMAVSGPWAVVSPIRVDAPAASLKLVLRPEPFVALTGRTIDPDGAPVRGVLLSFMVMVPMGNEWTGTGIDVMSGSDGRFSLPNLKREDQIAVTIHKSGYTLVGGGEITSSASGFSMVEPVLAALDSAVTGRVETDNGAPVAGAWVASLGEGGPPLPVRTDAKGRFDLSGLAAGDVSVVAAKGNLAGGAACRTGGKPAAIVLSRSRPTQPSDIRLGESILTKLISDASGSQYYAAGNIAMAAAAYDPDAALSVLSDAGQAIPDDVTLMQIMIARASVDPVAAAQWSLPRLASMGDAGDRAEASVTLGLDVVRQQPGLALQLYDIAEASAPAARDGQFGRLIPLQLPALAAALGRPEAKSLLQAAEARCAAEVTPAGGQTPMQALAGFMAAGNVELAEQIVANLPASQRADGNNDIVEGIAETNAPGAAALARTMLAQDPTSFSSAEVAETAIGQIGKGDPDAALALAEQVKSPYFAPTVLADAARFQSAAEADGLYRKAELLASGGFSSRSTPAMIAAMAWLRDKTVGAELFADIQRSIATDHTGDQPCVQSVQDFAFYYARVHPGFSRALIERQFSLDRATLSPNKGRDMEDDALAMAPVDVGRALEMAGAIGDTNDRFDAIRKIAQYVMAPSSIRLSMPFDRWSASDTWSPGSATGW